jgi:uncharacterized membrane protein YfcA
MLTQLIILVSVLGTSILSGVLGMAGGMVLMAILVSTVSVAAAMMVHGAVQATANGSRAWFLKQHIQWRILPWYAIGAAAALAAFTALGLVADAAVILIVVGAFAWLGRLVPALRGLDITHRSTAMACGAVVTAAQLFAGASGPLLDVFYLNTSLNRFQIIASKAFTQTLGHVLKLIYYGAIIGVVDGIPAWFYALAMAVAVLGTRIGTLALHRLDDTRFRSISSYVILTIATVCIVKGTVDLLNW